MHKLIRTMMVALAVSTAVWTPQAAHAGDPTGYGEMVAYGENLQGNGAGGELSDEEFWLLVELAKLPTDWGPTIWVDVPRIPPGEDDNEDEEDCGPEQQTVFDIAEELAAHMATYPGQEGMFSGSPNPAVSLRNSHMFGIAGWLANVSEGDRLTLDQIIEMIDGALNPEHEWEKPLPWEAEYYERLKELLNELRNSMDVLEDCGGATL